VDSTLDITPQFSCRTPELDDESKDYTDQGERYSSSQCFSTTNTDFFSADQNAIRRGVQLDNNISGPGSNTGMPVCYAPPV